MKKNFIITIYVVTIILNALDAMADYQVHDFRFGPFVMMAVMMLVLYWYLGVEEKI